MFENGMRSRWISETGTKAEAAIFDCFGGGVIAVVVNVVANVIVIDLLCAAMYDVMVIETWKKEGAEVCDSFLFFVAAAVTLASGDGNISHSFGVGFGGVLRVIGDDRDWVQGYWYILFILYLDLDLLDLELDSFIFDVKQWIGIQC